MEQPLNRAQLLAALKNADAAASAGDQEAAADARKLADMLRSLPAEKAAPERDQFHMVKPEARARVAAAQGQRVLPMSPLGPGNERYAPKPPPAQNDPLAASPETAAANIDAQQRARGLVPYTHAATGETYWRPDPARQIADANAQLRARETAKAANAQAQAELEAWRKGNFLGVPNTARESVSNAVKGGLATIEDGVFDTVDAGINLVDPQRNLSRFVSENVTPATEAAGRRIGEIIEGPSGRFAGMTGPLMGSIAGGVSEWGATMARDPQQGLTEAVDMLEPTHQLARGSNTAGSAINAAAIGDGEKARQLMLEATPDLLAGGLGVLPVGSFTVNAMRNAAMAPTREMAEQLARIPARNAQGAPMPVVRGGGAPPPSPGAIPPAVSPARSRAEQRADDIFIRKLQADGLTIDDVRKVQASLARRGDSGVYETSGELAALSGKSSGANLRGLQMAGGAAPGPLQEALITRVNENATKLSDRLSRAATRATGQNADNAVATLDELDARLRTEATPAYDEAYATPPDPVVFQNEILPVLNTPSGQEAIKAARNNLAAKAAELQGRAARGASDQAMREWNRAQEAVASIDAYLADPVRGTAIPTTMALDYTKRAFDDVIAKAGFGSDTARIVGGTKRSFADSVSQATGGKYGNALGVYSDVKSLEDAFETGLKALSQKTWQLQRDMAKGRNGTPYSGGEIEAIAMGVARSIEDMIEAGDNRALTALTKDKALKNIATALGSEEAAAKFEQSIRRLAANREWGRRVAGGSDTAMRQAAIRDAGMEGEDAVTRVLDRVETSGNQISLPGIVNDIAVKPLARTAKSIYQHLRYPGVYDEEVNRALVPLLSTPMTKGNLDEVIRRVEARLAEKGKTQASKVATASSAKATSGKTTTTPASATVTGVVSGGIGGALLPAETEEDQFVNALFGAAVVGGGAGGVAKLAKGRGSPKPPPAPRGAGRRNPPPAPRTPSGAPPVQSGFGGGRKLPDGYKKSLAVVHNLSEANLQHADEIGGLAAPSLAIIDSDKGAMTNFGEVSLLADPNILKSGGIRTFDSDVYSPRHPRAEYKITDKKMLDFRDFINKETEGLGDLRGVDWDSVSREGPSALARNDQVRAAFLKSRGELPARLPRKKMPEDLGAEHVEAAKLPGAAGNRWEFRENPDLVQIANRYYENEMAKLREIDPSMAKEVEDRIFDVAEDGTKSVSFTYIDRFAQDTMRAKEALDGGVDTTALSSIISRKLQNKKTADALDEYVSQISSNLFGERRLYKGMTYNGNRRYSPYTMENILREMTKTIRGGENWHYGAGSIRAKYARELKSLEDIRRNKEKLVAPGGMEDAKKAMQDKLSDLIFTHLEKYYRFKGGNRFSAMDEMSKAIADGPQAIREVFDFKGNPEPMRRIQEFIDELKSMPTEYFEAKASRAVGLNEFAVAVVPRGTSQKTIDILKRAGLKIKYYTKGDEASRAKAIQSEKQYLAGTGATATGLGGAGGAVAGTALAPDTNGDGVIDAQERMAGGMGGLVTGLGVGAGANKLLGSRRGVSKAVPQTPRTGPGFGTEADYLRSVKEGDDAFRASAEKITQAGGFGDYKVSLRYPIDSELRGASFNVTKNGEVVGTFDLYSPGHTQELSLHAMVKPEFQRQGVATQFYDFVESTTGKKLRKSETMSPEGKALWDARERRSEPPKPPAQSGFGGGKPPPSNALDRDGGGGQGRGMGLSNEQKKIIIGALRPDGSSLYSNANPKKLVNSLIVSGKLPEATRFEAVNFVTDTRTKNADRWLAKPRRGSDPLEIASGNRDWRLEQYKKQIAANAALDAPIASAWREDFRKRFKAASSVGSEYAEAEARRATVEAIVRNARKRGYSVRHVSSGRDGRNTSQYIVIPPERGGGQIRVSDHELPETDARFFAAMEGRGPRWKADIVVDDWRQSSLDDYLRRIEESMDSPPPSKVSPAPALKSGGGSLPPTTSVPVTRKPPVQSGFGGGSPKPPPGSPPKAKPKAPSTIMGSAVGRAATGGVVGGAVGALAGEADPQTPKTAQKIAENDTQIKNQLAQIAEFESALKIFSDGTPEQIQAQLDREGFDLGPTGIDGTLGEITKAAIRGRKNELNASLKTARERLATLENDRDKLKADAAFEKTRPTEEQLMFRDYAPLLGGIAGAAGAKIARVAGTTVSKFTAKSAIKKANALLNNAPIAKPRTAQDFADIEARAFNINEFWKRGGANQPENLKQLLRIQPKRSVPFESKKGGSVVARPLAKVLPPDELFPDRFVGRKIGAMDALIGGSAATEAVLAAQNAEMIKEKLNTARQALEKEKSEENYARVEELEDQYAQAKALMMLGIGAGVGTGLGVAFTKYASKRADVPKAEQELAILRQYFANQQKAAGKAAPKATGKRGSKKPPPMPPLPPSRPRRNQRPPKP